jgi:nicotinamidase-related amidase
MFDKGLPNAFSNRELEAFLIKHHVKQVDPAGLDAEYCAYATARGALKRRYQVSIITDGVVLKNQS